MPGKTFTEYMVCSYEGKNQFEARYTNELDDVPRVVRCMQRDYKWRKLYPNSFVYKLFERKVENWRESKGE